MQFKHNVLVSKFRTHNCHVSIVLVGYHVYTICSSLYHVLYVLSFCYSCRFTCFYHVSYFPNFCYSQCFNTHVFILFLSCFIHSQLLLLVQFWSTCFYHISFLFSCFIHSKLLLLLQFRNTSFYILCHVSTMFMSFCLIETCLLLLFMSYSRGMFALATLLHPKDEQKQPLCINTRQSLM